MDSSPLLRSWHKRHTGQMLRPIPLRPQLVDIFGGGLLLLVWVGATTSIGFCALA